MPCDISSGYQQNLSHGIVLSPSLKRMYCSVEVNYRRRSVDQLSCLRFLFVCFFKAIVDTCAYNRCAIINQIANIVFVSYLTMLC